MSWWLIPVLLIVAVLVYDIVQKKHAILRNFPIVGHFRYMLESLGPKLRQYIVASNNEERPFSRDERRWIYASSSGGNNYFGFGTDNDVDGRPNYLILKHSVFGAREPEGRGSTDPLHPVPCAKVLGRARDRAKAFRPASVVNVSGMSFGSLSGAAVEAMNRGCRLAGALHNTGEGGIAPYHDHGADLIWQLGTGYFGCRASDGGFDRDKFLEKVERYPVKAVELKLSQGAKPGLGGVLPGRKVTPEIAEIRGVPVGETVYSPPTHTAFRDVDEMLDFVEGLADESGLPIGIKSAVGETAFWLELAEAMLTGDRGVDFITIDGGEGGTGAGPLTFTDHVALPFKIGFSRVYRIFAEAGLQDDIVFTGSGRLGLPENAMLAFSLGCDTINVGREAMMAVGCIQAQKCHTDHCPTGVTTHNRWLVRGLDPTDKSAMMCNYLATLRKEILDLSRACGVEHPAILGAEHMEILDERFGSTTVMELFDYRADWGFPSSDDREEIRRIMAEQ